MKYLVKGDIYLSPVNSSREIEASSPEEASALFREVIEAEVSSGVFGAVRLTGRNAISKPIVCIKVRPLISKSQGVSKL